MGLGLSNMSFNDDEDVNYADQFFEQDRKYMDAENLITYLIDEAATQAILDLSMSGSDVGEDLLIAKRIGYSNYYPISKTTKQALCAEKDVVVVRIVPEQPIKDVIEEAKVGSFLVNEENFVVVDRERFKKGIHQLIEGTDFDLDGFYEQDRKRNASWISQIMNNKAR